MILKIIWNMKYIIQSVNDFPSKIAQPPTLFQNSSPLNLVKSKIDPHFLVVSVYFGLRRGLFWRLLYGCIQNSPPPLFPKNSLFNEGLFWITWDLQGAILARVYFGWRVIVGRSGRFLFRQNLAVNALPNTIKVGVILREWSLMSRLNYESIWYNFKFPAQRVLQIMTD